MLMPIETAIITTQTPKLCFSICFIVFSFYVLIYTKLNTVFGFCKMLTVFETNNCGHKKRASAYTIFAVRNSAVVGR